MLWWSLALVWGSFLSLSTWFVGGRHVDMRTRVLATLTGFTTLGIALQHAVPAVHTTTVVVIGAVVIGSCLAARRRYRRMTRPGSDSAGPGALDDWGAEGRTLLARFDHERDEDSLNRAIALFRMAYDTDVSGTRPLERAGDLVIALLGRYDRLGAPADLDTAIDVSRRSLTGAPAGTPRIGAAFAVLSRALKVRYDDFGDVSDLDAAVEAGEAAVANTETGEDRRRGLGALAHVLNSRHERSGDAGDHDEAVRSLRESLRGSPRRGPERVAALTTLCHWSTVRARLGGSGSLHELDKAVAFGVQAVRKAPAGHSTRALARMNLALALHARFERRGSETDLREAMRHARKAVRALPPDDPLRVKAQMALTAVTHSRYETFHHPSDLATALRLARTSAESRSGGLEIQVAANLAWAALAAGAHEHTQAVAGYTNAIELLPALADPELSRRDRELRLGRWNGVAVTAAACALETGRPDLAARLLEGGRGVLLAHALELPSDLVRLRTRNPALFSELARVRSGLDDVGADVPDRTRLSAEHRARRRALRERYDSLVERVRGEAGFADFARIPSSDDLLAQAAEGPIVYLNCARNRSDAIMVTLGGVRSVPLPDAAWETVTAHVAALLDAVAPERGLGAGTQRDVADVLAWLWDAVAEPVLTALDLPRPGSGEPLPRVWWVPTGLMAFLPIHAAGHHGTRGERIPRTVMDRVNSSYASTVRALAASRAHATVSAARPRPLVVAMPRTPGAEPLENAGSEARFVKAMFPGTRVLTGPRATRERVVAGLAGRTWAHFACHAVTDLDDPSRSRLLLHDHGRHGFTVADVSALRTGPETAERDALEMAYLAFCDGARPSERLPDEAVHLASAFQLAGFPQVVATLWPVHDAAAAAFTEDFYRELRAGYTPGARLNASGAMAAAARHARDRYPNLPSVWAGHVHVGA